MIKNKIRLLPIFIFMAVLTLTIKVNTIFDLYSSRQQKQLSISTASAIAEEKLSTDTKALSDVLQKGSPQNTEPGNSNNSFTQSEIIILQELAERREALDIRSQEIDKRAIQLKVTEEEINKKLHQLQEYEKKLQKLVNTYSEQEKTNINTMVKLYSNMKPKDAARIFNTLDMNIVVALLRGMKAAQASAVLAQMDATRAQAVTAELIGNNL